MNYWNTYETSDGGLLLGKILSEDHALGDRLMEKFEWKLAKIEDSFKLTIRMHEGQTESLQKIKAHR